MLLLLLVVIFQNYLFIFKKGPNLTFMLTNLGFEKDIWAQIHWAFMRNKNGPND